MLRLKKTNFWSRRFHETAISDFEMVTATTLIFHGYILTSLFFQILSIRTTSKRTDLGFSPEEWLIIHQTNKSEVIF